jgi:hypothetical protein
MKYSLVRKHNGRRVLPGKEETMKTYVFAVKHPGASVDVPEEIDMDGKFDSDRAKQIIKAKFPDSRVSFQGVKATVLEQMVADTSVQEPGYGPWK